MNRLLKCSNATPGLGYLPSSNTWAKRRETSDFADVSDLINKLLKCSNAQMLKCSAPANSGIGTGISEASKRVPNFSLCHPASPSRECLQYSIFDSKNRTKLEGSDPAAWSRV